MTFNDLQRPISGYFWLFLTISDYFSRHLFTPEEGQPTRLSESTCVICEIFFKYTTLQYKGSGLISFDNRLLSTWSQCNTVLF